MTYEREVIVRWKNTEMENRKLYRTAGEDDDELGKVGNLCAPIDKWDTEQQPEE